jgi:hypothetical protein
MANGTGYINKDYLKEAAKAGVISVEELSRWRSSLETAAEGGCFFCSARIARVVGRK